MKILVQIEQSVIDRGALNNAAGVMNKTKTSTQRWSRGREDESKIERRNFHAQSFRKRSRIIYAF